MSETIASVAEGGNVELVDERMQKIVGADPMTPEDAAFLARSLLACAAMLAFDKSIKAGTLVGDVHLPVLQWKVSVGTESRKPVVIFSIPPGIDLIFQLSPQIERELGTTLVAHAEGALPPELPSGGSVH
jgi:hypothetical protein